MSSLGLLEAKNEEKLKTNLVIIPPGQKQFAHFGGPSKFVYQSTRSKTNLPILGA